MQVARTALFIVVVGLTACGKGKSDTYAALDKHAPEYGRCEVMSEAREIEGKPAWLAASVCKAQHRQAVLADLPGMDAKKFDDHFTEWKKEKGPAAIAEARKNPSAGQPSGGGGGGGGGRMSESARMAIINDCNLGMCRKNTPVERASPENMACMASCCRSKGMKQDCRE